MSKILLYVKDWLDARPETEQDWLGKLAELSATETRAGWEFAKWLTWGVHEYSRTVDDIAHQLGKKPKTLANIVAIMRNPGAQFAQDLNREHGSHLTYSHVMEVAGLVEEEKFALLTEAAEQGLSVKELSWLRYQQEQVNLLPAGKLTGSAPLNDNGINDRTCQANGEGPTVPVLESQIDPSAGVCVWGMDEPDDVPFSHVPLSIDIPAPVKAFEIAEYIVSKWGKPMAREVVEELARWW